MPEANAPIRPAAVAGTFYPADSAALRTAVDAHLRQAPGAGAKPKALIVPHAGHVYSGAMAARAYRWLMPFRSNISRVVLLGPSHRQYVRGVAVPSVARFRTPLGDIPLAQTNLTALSELPFCHVNDRAHADEHSLEVHLPFLQTVLDDFDLLPIAVGEATVTEMQAVLSRLWGRDETLIVISTDLSHFLSYDQARKIDARTRTKILEGVTTLTHEEACGATPLNGFRQVAKQMHLQPVDLGYCNSGDTAGDRSRVVGYGALAFVDAKDALGCSLLMLARNALEERLRGAAPSLASIPALADLGATFVTLTKFDQLRGCIGTLSPFRALRDDVRANALAAAFSDPRFPQLTANELAETKIEVSMLSAQEPLAVTSEIDACQALRPGHDGVVLECVGHRATFLPQVWSQLPTPRAFLAALKQKAGLPADYWSDDLRLARYCVEKWAEA